MIEGLVGLTLMMLLCCLRIPISFSMAMVGIAGYAYMRWFHQASGRLMVATPTMRDELTRHGFRNIKYFGAYDQGVEPGATDRLVAVAHLWDAAD